jgi:hypothetical protein
MLAAIFNMNSCLIRWRSGGAERQRAESCWRRSWGANDASSLAGLSADSTVRINTVAPHFHFGADTHPEQCDSSIHSVHGDWWSDDPSILPTAFSIASAFL